MFTTFTNQSKSVHHNPGVNSEVFSNKISTAEHILEHMFNLMHAIPITPRHRKENSEDKQPIQAASPVILITLDLVQSLHGLSLPQAAKVLGISVTAFKNACRRLGIRRWEYTRGKGRAKELMIRQRAADISTASTPDRSDPDRCPASAEDDSVIDGGLARAALKELEPLGEEWASSNVDYNWPDAFNEEPVTESDEQLVRYMLAQGWS